MIRRLMLLLVAAAAAAPLHAQEVQTGISRDTIRVGDPFRAVVRIRVEPGTNVVLPDSLPSAEDLENAGRVRARRDSTSAGVSIAAAYPLTAWRPGRLALPGLDVLLQDATGERALSIRLPEINVVSVLPADTAGIQPKPLKDVLGGNRVWWPWLLAALLLLIALALAYWWWRRRRAARPAVQAMPVIMPRERALEELERIRKLGLIEQRDFKSFYTLMADVLRQYMATVETEWSPDLTTEELAARTRGSHNVANAISVLRSSDYVKFARGAADAYAANADWSTTHNWIAAYPPPQQPELEAA